MVHTSQQSFYSEHYTMTGIFSMFWKMDVSVIRRKREKYSYSAATVTE
jgi:hypothetical protein